MANPASSSVDAFLSLDEGQQRTALGGMSDEAKTSLLQAIQGRPQSSLKSPIPPPTFAPKVPDPISGLKGEEDTSGITVASPGTFSDRVGDRIKQNIYAVPQALDSLKRKFQGKPATDQDKAQSSYFDNLVGGPDYRKGNVSGTLTGAVKSAMLVPHMVYDMGKSWTQDPANAVGDVVAGYVMHHASSSGLPDQAVPSKMQIAEKVPLTDEQQAAYTKALDKANAKHTQALADYAESEAAARSKWVQEAFKAKQSAVDTVKAVNKKEILNRGVDEYTKVAQDNLQKTHDAVRGQLDNRWNSLRDAMQDATVPSSDIFNAVESAKNEFLRGSPASTQQFNNLVKEIGVEKFIEDEHGGLTATPDNAPVPWDTARVHSSAIGNALSSGNLPGNVYQALKAVRTAIEDQLGKAAEQQGRGDEYNSVRKDWSNYMTDWKDTSGVNKGGSPLAHALATPDAQNVTKIINGPAGDRMIGTLAKYKKFGGRPDLLAATRSTSAAADAVKVPTTKAMPAPYEADTPPEIKAVPPPGAIPKKLGPLTKGAVHLAGGALGAKLMSPTGHTFVGYMAGSKALSALAESMMENQEPGIPAVPPKIGKFTRAMRAAGRAKNAAINATGPYQIPTVAVVGARALRGEDADSKAIQDAHESIEDFINSLPK